jgi:cell division protein FtsW
MSSVGDVLPMQNGEPSAGRGDAAGSSAAAAPTVQHLVGKPDALLFGLVVALVLFGVVMVFSASSVRAARLPGSGHAFLTKQGIYACLGLTLTWLISRADYRRFRHLAPAGLVVSVGLLLAVVSGLGHNAGGASRWIRLGFFNVQPAELAKGALILWLADSLSRKEQLIRTFRVGFVPHAAVAIMLMALCMLQPDFGSSVVLALLTFVLMFTAGVRVIYMLGAMGVVGLFAYAAILYAPYRWKRISAFMDPMRDRSGGGYQIVESWVSFSEGGLFGVGLGDSRQKMLFLPEAHTDFIAAIVAEELGFIGFCVMVLAFSVLVVRGLRAAYGAADALGFYLGVGFTMFIGMQAATNLAVVLGLLPTKGLTLPFLSFGGSSLLVNCAAAGVLLSVSRPGRAPIVAPVPPAEPRRTRRPRVRPSNRRCNSDPLITIAQAAQKGAAP